MNNKGGEASPTITGISPEESWISRMCFIFPLFFFWQRHELIAKEWSEHDRLEHHRDDGGAVTPLVVDTCWVRLCGLINMFQGCLVCSPICSHSFCLSSGLIYWVAQSIDFPWIFPTFLYWNGNFLPRPPHVFGLGVCGACGCRNLLQLLGPLWDPFCPSPPLAICFSTGNQVVKVEIFIGVIAVWNSCCMLWN